MRWPLRFSATPSPSPRLREGLAGLRPHIDAADRSDDRGRASPDSAKERWTGATELAGLGLGVGWVAAIAVLWFAGFPRLHGSDEIVTDLARRLGWLCFFLLGWVLLAPVAIVAELPFRVIDRLSGGHGAARSGLFDAGYAGATLLTGFAGCLALATLLDSTLLAVLGIALAVVGSIALAWALRAPPP